VLADDERREAKFSDADATVAMSTFVERLRPMRASVVATWTGDDPLLSDAPAVTRNQVGKGFVYYVGGYCGAEGVSALVTQLIPSMGIKAIIDAAAEVEVIERSGPNGRFVSLFNHGATPQTVRGVRGHDLVSEQRTEGELSLPAYGVAIVQLGG